MPVAKLQHRVVNHEYGEVRIRRRFSIACDVHIGVNCLTGTRGRAPETRLDLEFTVRPSDREFCEGEAFARQFALTAGASEVDRYEGVWSVFFFDRQLDAAGIARERHKQ